MQEKIKNILFILDFINEFDTVLKSKSRAIFQCNNKEFEKNYSQYAEKLKKCYKFVFKVEKATGCGQNFLDHYFEVKQISLKKLVNIMNINHKLKQDSRIYWIDGDPYSWMSAGLTNEICQKIYDKDPSAFETFDHDWKKQEQVTTEQVLKVKSLQLKEFFVAGKVPEVETKAEEVPEPVKKKKPAPRKKSKK